MNKYVTIAILVVIVALLVAYRNKLTALFTRKPAPNAPATVIAATIPASLDRDKVLRSGVTGPEVTYLQMILGVKQDGIFGPVTEAALQDEKCVKETTLNTYDMQTCITPGVDQDVLGAHGDWSMADEIINSLDNLQFNL